MANFTTVTGDNIDYILQNMSCCIANEMATITSFIKTRQKECLNSKYTDILLLDAIYQILKQGLYCESSTCFTTTELNKLYQMSYSLCGFCTSC